MALFPWFDASSTYFKKGMAFRHLYPGNSGKLERVATCEFLLEMGPLE